MKSRGRTVAVSALAAVLGASIALGLSSPGSPASAQTAPPPLSWAPNPWVLTETDPAAEGLRINATGSANGQPLIVYDHLNQPIFGVNRAGGLWVAGDNFTVFDGSDIFHGQVVLSPSTPDPAVCVRAGQLWLGGPAGRIWRCSGSPLAWRTIL